MVKKTEKKKLNLYVIQQYFGHVIIYDCNIRKKNSFLYVIKMNQYFFKSPGEA